MLPERTARDESPPAACSNAVASSRKNRWGAPRDTSLRSFSSCRVISNDCCRNPACLRSRVSTASAARWLRCVSSSSREPAVKNPPQRRREGGSCLTDARVFVDGGRLVNVSWSGWRFDTGGFGVHEAGSLLSSFDDTSAAGAKYSSPPFGNEPRCCRTASCCCKSSASAGRFADSVIRMDVVKRN